MGAFSNMDYELQNSEAAVSDAFTEDDATRIFLATLQLAYLFFHGLLHPHYADNLYYLSNH